MTKTNKETVYILANHIGKICTDKKLPYPDFVKYFNELNWGIVYKHENVAKQVAEQLGECYDFIVFNFKSPETGYWHIETPDFFRNNDTK